MTQSSSPSAPRTPPPYERPSRALPASSLFTREQNRCEMELHERIQKLQSIEETLHAYLAQKQQVQSKLMELESAAEALKSAKTSFRIIGNIMVERPVEELQQETAEQLSRTKVRLEALEKQERRLKEQAETIQKEVVESMKNTAGDVNGDAQ
ncbi:hypothetical protein D6789_04720 [Candidatus Woesearchaeota archaeon]|nr:MAG: hypothetical protein D6789_04720 [Candidatus Woesearchaeota archaeon]